MSKPKKIMVVDDTPSNIELLNDVLSTKGYSISGVPSGSLALKVVHNFNPDLILLDIMMPGMDGYSVAKELKATESTKGIPIIFVTAKAEPEEIELGFKHGAVDYITKPIKAEEVWARVNNQMQIIELKKKQDYFVNQLSVQENRYRAILESSTDPMLTVSPPGRVSWVNHACEELLESLDYEINGRDFVDFLEGEDTGQYSDCFNHESFGSGETLALIETNPHRVKVKSAKGNVKDMELAVSRVDLNYPLFLCHFHYLSD